MMSIWNSSGEREKKEPLWKERDRLSKREGLRAPIYEVNLDVYRGEWTDDRKHGKGTYEWKKSGSRYDGEWEEGERRGFGTYSIKYSSGLFQKVYAGNWKHDKKHGYGTYIYNESEHYEGEWADNQRNGWGKMYYKDESIYQGEWYAGKRHGKGFLRQINGNRYEGMWENDKKNGPGKLFYMERGLVYTGNWKDNIAKCGTIEHMDPVNPVYPFPMCELQDPIQVLEDARVAIGQPSA